MIKKLKRKFIFIFMSLIMLMLIGLFLLIGISTSLRLEKDSMQSLSRHLSAHQSSIRRSSSIVLTLKFSKSGRQIDSQENTRNFSLSDSEVKEISSYCLDTKKESGTVPGYPLLFLKKETHDSMKIAFYDLTQNRQTMHSLYISFLIAGIISMAVFSIVSLFLANWCVRPIEKTWILQQNFVADASHELKTPLTVILANTAILKDHSDKPIYTKTKCITYIEEEAKHMSRLINDMLFLAKTDAFKETIKKDSVNLSDICTNSYLSFESVAFEKNIFLAADIEENIYINGVSDKLNQLFGIVLDNACKYTDENGKIHFSLHKKGNTILFKLNNSGAPIPKEHLSHLFERFYRVDEARTRSCSGYGLGLSIARSIVEMHHGKINITSSKEEGTTVQIELTAAE